MNRPPMSRMYRRLITASVLALLLAGAHGTGWTDTVTGIDTPATPPAPAPAPDAEEIAETLNPPQPPPSRGVLVSELRERLSRGDRDPETIVRLYEDNAGNQVREFSLNGHLFQVEVIPANGMPPYLLVDTTGDGLFDMRVVHSERRVVVPQWVLFRF
jgi:hypothetical protein